MRTVVLMMILSLAAGCALPQRARVGAVASPGGAEEVASASRAHSSFMELRLAHDEPAAGLERVEFEGETLYLDPRPVLSDAALRSVRPYLRRCQLVLDMRLSPEGGTHLQEMTGANVGNRMALLIDSRVWSAPVIRGAVGERIQAGLTVTEDEAKRIIQQIHARWPEGDGGR